MRNQFTFDIPVQSAFVLAQNSHRYQRVVGEELLIVLPQRAKIVSIKMQVAQSSGTTALIATSAFARFFALYDNVSSTVQKFNKLDGTTDSTLEINFTNRDSAYCFQGYENFITMQEPCAGLMFEILASTFPSNLTALQTFNYSFQITVDT
jgi:hypothetical protein